MRFVLAFVLSLLCGSAFAQVTPGTSPLSGAKGGTNNAFMQFNGPASSLKTYTLPNASDTLAALGQIQIWTGAQSFSDGKLILLGSGSGSSTLKAPATGGGTATLFSGTDTVVGLISAQSPTNKTISGSTNVLGGVTMTLGSDATGDIYYRNSSGILTRLGVGSNTNVLTLSGGLPSWQAGSSAASITVGTTTVNTGTTLNFLYNNAGTLANTPLVNGYGIVLSGTANATIAVSLTTAQAALGSNVAMGTAGTFTDGPSMAQGATGVWAVSGTVSFVSSSGVAIVACKLWDGTNVINSGFQTTSGTGVVGNMTISGNSVANPPGNIKITCKDTTSNNTSFQFNTSGLSRDSNISGHRIQ